jgi:hypothetical protein
MAKPLHYRGQFRKRALWKQHRFSGRECLSAERLEGSIAEDGDWSESTPEGLAELLVE